MSITRDTRIIDLTVGEFEDYLSGLGITREKSTPSRGKYVYGLTGIRELFHCSESTAVRLKNGKIKDAVSQYGRKIVVDVDKAMKLFNQ